jgi:hypothetical protein
VHAWRFSFALHPPSVLSLVQFNTHLKRPHKQTLVCSTNQTLTVASLWIVVAIQRVASLQCFVSSLLLCSLESLYSSSVYFFFIKSTINCTKKYLGHNRGIVAYMEFLILPKDCSYEWTKLEYVKCCRPLIISNRMCPV